ncbi:hypothetical protein EC844_12921 [Acinetobacter calcoaceticus]|uniref:Uncharacterized protein n=1 Tax=Acinetobacter calcoaceticus TaxID=471 RepID=A0A4V2QZL1_ACICA|nr:hypothetical protein EC844_12921 [Acinetobacter calcoaceticus]
MSFRFLVINLNSSFYIRNEISLFNKIFKVSFLESDKFEEKLGFVAEKDNYVISLIDREDREYGILSDESDTIEFKFVKNIDISEKNAFERHVLILLKDNGVFWDKAIWIDNSNEVLDIKL